MEGILLKKSTSFFKSYQSRYFKTSNLYLKYYTTETDYDCKEAIELKNIVDIKYGIYEKEKVDKKDKINADCTDLYIILIDRVYELRAPTSTEAIAWVECLKVYVDSKSPNIPKRMSNAMIACLDYLDKKSSSIEGIFRIAGSSNEIKLSYRNILINGIDVIQDSTNVHNVSAIFKMLLRNIPQSLLTNALFSKFVDSATDVAAIKKLVGRLPDININILGRIIKLCLELNRHVQVTKMEVKQLSICLGPNLVDTSLSLQETLVHMQPLFTTLMSNYGSIFGKLSNSDNNQLSQSQPTSAKQNGEIADKPTASLAWAEKLDNKKNTPATAIVETVTEEAVEFVNEMDETHDDNRKFRSPSLSEKDKRQKLLANLNKPLPDYIPPSINIEEKARASIAVVEHEVPKPVEIKNELKNIPELDDEINKTETTAAVVSSLLISADLLGITDSATTDNINKSVSLNKPIDKSEVVAVQKPFEIQTLPTVEKNKSMNVALGLFDDASDLDVSVDLDNSTENLLEDSMDVDAKFSNFMSNAKSKASTAQNDQSSNVNESFYSTINDTNEEEAKFNVPFEVKSKELSSDISSPIQSKPEILFPSENKVKDVLIKKLESQLAEELSNRTSISAESKERYALIKRLESELAEELSYRTIISSEYKEREDALVKKLESQLAEELSYRTTISAEYKEREDKLIQQHLAAPTEYKEREDILMQQYRQLESLVDSLQKKLDLNYSSTTNLQQSLDVARSKNIDLQQQIDVLEKKVKGVVAPDIVNFQTRMLLEESIKEDLNSQYKIKLSQLQEENVALISKINAYESNPDALLTVNTGNTSPKSELSKANRAIITLQSKIRTLELLISRQTVQLEAAVEDKKTISMLQAQISEEAIKQAAEFKNQHIKLSQAQENVKEMNTVLLEMQAQRDQLHLLLQETQQKATVDAKFALESCLKCDGYKKQIAALNSNIEGLNKDLEESKLKFASMRDFGLKNAMLLSDINLKENIIESQSKKLEDIKESRSSHLQTLEAQLIAKNKIIEDLRKRLDSSLGLSSNPTTPSSQLQRLKSSANDKFDFEPKSPSTDFSSPKSFHRRTSSYARLESSKLALQTQLETSKLKLREIESRARVGLDESKKRLEALERELNPPSSN